MELNLSIVFLNFFLPEIPRKLWLSEFLYVFVSNVYKMGLG